MDEADPAANRVLAVAVEKRSDRGGRYFADVLFYLGELSAFNVFILFDAEIDLHDDSLILWKLFNNTDPGRDLMTRNDRLVVDACKKGPADGHEREWPDELTFDEGK